MLDKLLKKMDGAYAENTIKAYQSDFTVFSDWCASKELCPLPAEPETMSVILLSLICKTVPLQLFDGALRVSADYIN